MSIAFTSISVLRSVFVRLPMTYWFGTESGYAEVVVVLLATPAGYCSAVPYGQDELGTIIGPKKHQRGVLCPIEGCWGPILPFGSCRLGHF